MLEGDAHQPLLVKPIAPCDASIPVKPDKPWLVFAAMMTVTLLFSGWHVVGKVALNTGFSPLIFGLYRELGATVCMFAVARIVDGRFIVIARSDVPRFMALGCLSFGNVVGFIIALSDVSPENASVVQPSVPVIAMLLSAAVGYERLGWRKVVGVFLAVSGAVIVVLSAAVSLAPGHARTTLLTGNIILVIQCASMASLLVVQKPVLARYPSTTVTAWYYLFGTFLTIIVSTYMWDRPESFIIHGWRVWMGLSYAIVFATLVCYTLYSWSNQRAHASTVAVFSTLQPFGATALAAVFLHDHISLWQVLGGLIISVGLLLALSEAAAAAVRGGGGAAPAATLDSGGARRPSVASVSLKLDPDDLDQEAPATSNGTSPANGSGPGPTRHSSINQPSSSP